MTTKRLVIAFLLASAAAGAAAAEGSAPNVRGGHGRRLDDNSSGYEVDNADGFDGEGGNMTDGWEGNATEGHGWGGGGGGGGWSHSNGTEGHEWGGNGTEGWWNRNKTEGDWNGTQGYYGWNRNKTDGGGWGGNQSEGGGGFGHGDGDHGGGGRGQGAFRQFFASVFNSLFGGGQGGWGSGGGSWGGSGDGGSGWGGQGGWGSEAEGDHGLGGCWDDFGDVNFTTRNCSASAGIPECTFSREGGTGSLVCRTLFNRFTGVKETSTECIDPEKSLPLDECGCCGGVCPQECPCACDSHDGSVGVQVLKNGESGEGFCVPSSYATTLLARGKVECAANCTATAGNNTTGVDSNGTAVVTANDTAV
jgi:hypothetical protein